MKPSTTPTPAMRNALRYLLLDPDLCGAVNPNSGQRYHVLSACMCCAAFGVRTIGVDHDADIHVATLALQLGVTVRDVESLPHVAASESGEPLCDVCAEQIRLGEISVRDLEADAIHAEDLRQEGGWR